MADARKRAEEWLGRYGDDDPLTLYGLENSRVEAARLLRALLAEEPGAEKGKGRRGAEEDPADCTEGSGGALCDRCFAKITRGQANG